jgi:hypothetical protein
MRDWTERSKKPAADTKRDHCPRMLSKESFARRDCPPGYNQARDDERRTIAKSDKSFHPSSIRRFAHDRNGKLSKWYTNGGRHRPRPC